MTTESFEEKSFPTVIPSKLPQQQNLCDCGVFMLEYAKNFLSRPPTTVRVWHLLEIKLKNPLD